MRWPSWFNPVTWGIVLIWYFSNIGVIMLNKELLSVYGFRYPILLTQCHMAACSIMAYGVASAGVVPRVPLKSRQQLGKVVALALVFCVAIVLSNVSLRIIPVSFNQAISSTTPFFTAAFAFMILAKRESFLVYCSLVPVVLGVVIASGFEPSFDMFGFVACVCSTAARALKSVMGAALLSAEQGEQIDSMNLLLYMAPVVLLSLVPTTIILEPGALISMRELAQQHQWFLPLLILNSCLAYCQNLSNFLVTKHTSALTLQVLGNVKGVVAVVASILWFRNPVNVASMMGYAITVSGVVAYSQAKNRGKKPATPAKGASMDEEAMPMFTKLTAVKP